MILCHCMFSLCFDADMHLLQVFKRYTRACLFVVPAGGSRRHLTLQWATYHYMIVNMPCADALNSEGLRGGEGEARGHEDQLNSDCTTGEGTKNNPTPLCFSPRLRDSKIPDRHCTVCALTGAKAHLCAIGRIVVLEFSSRLREKSA